MRRWSARACTDPTRRIRRRAIFTAAARQILAEDALKHAHRLDHAEVSTGHILLATLDACDHTAARIIGDGVMGSGPVSDRLGRELIRTLPGEERRHTEVDHGLIQIDMVIRTLALEFSNIVPTGWTLRGSGRSGGIRLRVPESGSEEDFRIDLGWIVAQDGHATDRLRQVALASLETLQQSIVAHTGAPWPPATSPTGPPKPGAELVGDDDNPALRLWYGEPDAPALEIPVDHPLLLNMLLNAF